MTADFRASAKATDGTAGASSDAMRMMALGLVGTGRRATHGRLDREAVVKFAIVVALVALVAAIAGSVGQSRREIRALPPDQRVALYARTMADLRDFCGEGRPEALRDHCRTLAEFVVQFDECRADCEAVARPQLVARPTR